MPMNSKDLYAMCLAEIDKATRICAFCVHAQHEQGPVYWCFEKQKAVLAKETCEYFAGPTPFKRRRKKK